MRRIRRECQKLDDFFIGAPKQEDRVSFSREKEKRFGNTRDKIRAKIFELEDTLPNANGHANRIEGEIEKWKRREKKIKDYFLLNHMALLVSKALEFSQDRDIFDPSDLVGYGQLALVKSWDFWNPYKRKFSSYAGVAINNAFYQYVREVLRDDKLQEKIIVHEEIQKGLNGKPAISIDNYTREELDQCTALLSDKERRVLRLRYGNDFGIYSNGITFTLASAGRKMGITYEGVRKIEQKALKKMRARLTA